MADYKNVAPVEGFDWDAYENGGQSEQSREAQEQAQARSQKMQRTLHR